MSKIKIFLIIITCIILVGAIASAIYKAYTSPPDTSAEDGELHQFTSTAEIEKLVRSIYAKSESSLFDRIFNRYKTYDIVYEDGITVDGAGQSETSKPTSSNADSAQSQSHSDTYLQVGGVDEADIVKTDGKHIYYVNDKREVLIYEPNDGNPKKIATIGYGGTENYVDNIFLKGDSLITVGWVYDYKIEEGYTAVVLYDISNPAKPEEIKTFRQSGSILSSRMVGDYVYLVTNNWINQGEDPIPHAVIDDEYKPIPVTDICCIPNPESANYTILSAIDVASGKDGKTKTKAIFGFTDIIYCNNESLYVASPRWNYRTDETSTTIAHAKLDGLDIAFDRRASIEGRINDQFSMDETKQSTEVGSTELKPYFRIATTSRRDFMDVNHLFILDDKLKVVGSINGFARNENIKAVRFMGDKAYIITYEQIDPLFVIDVSNPEKPMIEGEVKIDGFSSLLIPCDDDKVLGIGYATGDNGYGGEFQNGLKLALFDVSNPSEPAVLDSKEFENMESPAQNTHLALVANWREGWFAIPYFIPDYYGDEMLPDDDIILDEEAADSMPIDEDVALEDSVIVAEDTPMRVPYEGDSGVLIFDAGTADDSKINIINKHTLCSEYINRSVYIGHWMYAFDHVGEVYSFEY